MKTKGIAFLVCATLASVALVTVIQTLPPPALPMNAPASEFSAERAMQHLKIIAAQPRFTGSPAYEAAADYVLAELEYMGLETETQRVGDLRNTLGWIRGDRSSDIVLLTAHLDSFPMSPGAADDASGVAVLLETARALRSADPLRNTVMFLFTDAEEFGSKGAREFIYNHPLAQNVKVVIGFDAGGIGGPDVLTATSQNNGWLIRQLARSNPKIAGSSAINALATTTADFTSAFQRAGFSGYAFSLYWDDRIHSPEDSIENLNPASVQHQGYHALSLARHYGNLDPMSDSRKSDAVYFSVFQLFIVSYSPAWAVVMAITLVLMFIAVLAYGRIRRVFSWLGIAYGMFVLLVGVSIATLPEIFLGSWISDITSHVSDRRLIQPFQASLYILTALVLILLWFYLSQKFINVSIFDLTIGALVPMVITMMGASIVFPTISYALAWPLLFSLLANTFWLYSDTRQKLSQMVFLGLLFAGAASIVIIGPILILGSFEVEHIQLTLIFLGILSGFLIPQIHLIWRNPIEV